MSYSNCIVSPANSSTNILHFLRSLIYFIHVVNCLRRLNGKKKVNRRTWKTAKESPFLRHLRVTSIYLDITIHYTLYIVSCKCSRINVFFFEIKYIGNKWGVIGEEKCLCVCRKMWKVWFCIWNWIVRFCGKRKISKDFVCSHKTRIQNLNCQMRSQLSK